MQAVRYADLEIVKMLIEAGADVNTIILSSDNDTYFNVMDFAKAYDKQDIVGYLKQFNLPELSESELKRINTIEG